MVFLQQGGCGIHPVSALLIIAVKNLLLPVFVLLKVPGLKESEIPVPVWENLPEQYGIAVAVFPPVFFRLHFVVPLKFSPVTPVWVMVPERGFLPTVVPEAR